MPPEQPTGYIYFIRSVSGPIKIGYSADPVRRFHTLKIGTHETLELIGVLAGSKQSEKRLHSKFKSDLIRGEWFTPSSGILALVATADAPPSKALRLSTRVMLPLDVRIIAEAITKADHNIADAAILLGCSRRTLQNRMRALGMPEGRAGRPPRLRYADNGPPHVK